MCDWLSGNFAWVSGCCKTKNTGGTGLGRNVVLNCVVDGGGTGPRRITVLNHAMNIGSTGPRRIVLLDRVVEEIGPW
eukprot:5040370-Ditylum_brightwellii.AAC.1